MTAPNHITGGLVITGLFGSFMNLNILANPWYIVTTVIASLLPDIDHSRSIIGKLFLPLSRWLNRRFGHRTITHSIIALLILSFIVAFFESHCFQTQTHSKIFFLAYSSHLILDMMTVQGVPLLYPFLKNPCVMPGNPDLRFRTGNLRTETMVFCFFLLSCIFLQPLIKNGFWTQYNRFFGTPKHLASEFRKSEDALFVTYKVKKGTELITGEGICIEASDNKIVLLENNQFKIYNQPEYNIQEVIPEHIGKSLKFKAIRFIDISLDSLNKLIQEHPLKRIEIQSNNYSWIHHDFTKTKKKQFKADYPNELWIEEIKADTIKETFTTYINPKIKTLHFQIANLKREDKRSLKNYNKNQLKLKKLEFNFEEAKDLFAKEQLLKKIRQLKKNQAPNLNTEKIVSIQLKIAELQRSDQIKNLEQEKILKAKYLQNLPSRSKFSGTIVKVMIVSEPKGVHSNH